MADSKSYTIGFNLLDNFSSKFDALQAKLSRVTDVSHSIKFEVDSSAVSKTEDGAKGGQFHRRHFQVHSQSHRGQ